MADHKAARERATTFLKDQTKVVNPHDLPVLDECPICLDTYHLEQPVRIKIEGCAHVFGRSCLTAMLTNNPRLEKKCPLCRTKWMDAPAGALSNVLPRTFNGLLERPDVTFSELFSPRSVTQRPAVAQTHRPGRTDPPPARSLYSRMPSGRSQGGVINLIDSDDDEEDPLESFNSITRDINSVRERARNTQISRKQRKEEKKQSEPAAPNSRGTTTIKRGNGSTNEQGQQEQPTPFSNSFRDPPPHRPMLLNLENLIQQNWGLTDTTQDANQSADRNEDTAMDLDEGGAPRSSESNQGWHTVGYASFLPQDRPQNTFISNHPPRSSSLRATQRPKGPRHPFVLSPSPESDTDTDRTRANRAQKERLDQREKVFTEREVSLDARERGLNDRERLLEERDKALFQREQRIAQRETNERRLADVRQRQLREMQAMTTRHQEEMMTQP